MMSTELAQTGAARRTTPPKLLPLKRATDFVASGIVLAATAPFLLLVAAIVKLDSKGPALFKQKRVGKNGELFEILKFRTMRTDAPNVATDVLQKMGINPITKVGAVLRKTSIDELPQLINVLRGEMSLVGPRPALYNQYDLTEMRNKVGALRMPPGITGWAQVNGRDEISDQQKVEYDAFYCDNWSYLFDWKILAQTVLAVLGGRGVN